MIEAIIIANLLFFPTPTTREPLGREIALTQWGAAYIGVAHNDKAGAAFYQADTVRILINNEWRYYEVVESGIYLCDVVTPNCNNKIFKQMYEPNAVILATCYPIGGMTRGQWIIKLMPTIDTMYKTKYTLSHDKN